MENRAKKWVVAVLFAVLFACIAAFSLGVVVFNNTRARAAEASPKHDYETIRVEYSLIYASDTSSELIKDHLTVYGTAAGVDGEVELERGEYTVYLGNAESGTTDNWELSTSVSNTFTVVAGDAQATFSAVAVAVRVSSVVVKPSFTVSGGANYKDGSVLYLYTFDNVKDNITVVGYNNDGRPYNGTVENSTLSADAYSVIGSSDPGTQSLSVQWAYEGSTITSSNFTVVLTQDEVKELIVNEETLPESVESSREVSFELFPGLEITARYLSGKEEILAYDNFYLSFSGTLHDATANVDEIFTETITVSYNGNVSVQFEINVVQVAPVSITLGGSTAAQVGSAYGVLDTTNISVSVEYDGEISKYLSGLTAENFDIEYVNPNGNHKNDGFRVGDTQAIVTYIEAGVSSNQRRIRLSISQTPVDAPTFDEQDLTFNGNEQSKTLGAAYDAEIMKITDGNGNSSSELMTFDQDSGTVTVTNAGTYTFRVYLTDKNYTFSSTPSGAASKGEDDNGEYIVYTFTVAKQSFENWSFTVNISDWIYQQYSTATNGPSVAGLPEEVSWNWDKYITYYFYGQSDDGSFNQDSEDPQNLNEEELKALGVGEYYVYAVIAETTNYQGHRIPGAQPFFVTKRTLATPSGLDQIYNGTPQQANTEGLFGYGDIFTMECEPETNVANDYSVKFTITEGHFSNYQWQGGSQSIELTWDITKATPSMEVSVENWTYSKTPSTPSTTVKFDGKINENIDYTVKYVYYYDVNKDKSYTQKMPGEPSSGWAAGSYKVVATISETSNYKGEEAIFEFEIARLGLAAPEVVYTGGEGGYIYSGSAINVTVRAGYLEGDITVTGTGSLSPYFTVGGTFTATDAKNGYSLQLTPTANYAWEGGSQDAQSILWNILPKKLTAPTADGGTFPYDGTNKVYTFSNYQTGMTFTVTPDADEDKDGLTSDVKAGKVTAIHAGTYTIEVGLVSENYAWADEYDLTFEFVIDRATTANPAITGYDGDGGYIYNYGETITVQVTPDNRKAGHYTFAGDVSATDARRYELIIKLDSDYQWQTASAENGNNVLGDLTLAWNIVAREIEEPALDTLGNTTYTGESLNATLTYDDRAVNISFTADDPSDEDGKSISGNTLTVFHAGGYTVRATLENTSNFVWQEGGTAEKTLTWQVAKAQNAVTGLSIGDWVYGEETKQPSYRVNFGTATIDYEYSATKDGSWESKPAPGDAGHYRVTVSVKADENSDWEAAAAVSKEFLVERASVKKPELGAFDNMYTGKEINVVLSGEGLGEKYEIESGGSGTNADDYTVRLKLTQNYKWEDDESAYDENVRYYEIDWTIVPRALDRLTLASANTSVKDDTLPGEPEEQENELFGYNPEYASAYVFTEQSKGLSRENNMLSATDAGVYSVTVSLANGNFAWKTEGEASYTLKWTIDKKVVHVETTGGANGRYIVYGEGHYPEDIYNSAADSVYYDYSEQTFWRYSGGSVVPFEGTPSDYGIYYISFKLKKPDNFVFEKNGEDGTADGENDLLAENGGEIKIWYSISKAGYTLTAQFSGGVNTFEYGSGLGEIDYDISGENGEVIAAIKAEQATVSYIYFTAEGERLETAPTDAGSYYVVVHISEPEGGNYRAMDSNEIPFTIAPKKLKVTFTGDAFNDGKYSFMYGTAAEAAISVEGYAENLGDSAANVSVEIEYYTSGGDPLGAFPKTVAQNNYIVTAFTENKNYDIEGGVNEDSRSSISADYIITPAELTVTVDGQNLTYGDPLGEWDLSATGWVKAYGNEQAQYETDFFNKVKGARALSTLYGAGSSVGEYDIALNEEALTDLGEWAGNYVINYDYDAQIIVTARSLTVEITGGQDSFVYGTVIDYGYNITGGLYRDEDKETFKVVLTYSGTDYASTTDKPQNVGTYIVTVTLEKVGEYVLNYVLNGEVSKTFTITQKPLKIAIGNEGIIYGSDAPESWTVDYVGVLPADAGDIAALVSGHIYCDYKAGDPKGDYTITINDLTAIQNDAPNYNITKTDGTLNVKPRQITVIIDKKTSIYGDEIVGLTADVDASGNGVLEKDGTVWELFAKKGEQPVELAPSSDAGEYTISGRCINDNYTINFKDGTYTITPKQVEIAFALSGGGGGFTVTYSGTQQEMTAKVIGTVNNDSISATITYDKTPINAGGYTATATLADENEKANNYYVTRKGAGTAEDEYVYVRTAEQQFTIKKATLTVHAKESDGRVTYGDAAAFAYTLTGFVNGEESQQSEIVKGEIKYESDYKPGAAYGSVRDDGYYVKYLQGLSADNYDFVAAAENGTFEVVARKISIVIDIATSFEYGSAEGAQASVNEDETPLTDSIRNDARAFTYSYAGKDAEVTQAFPTFVGEYTVTVSLDDDNYILTGELSKFYKITKKDVHVTAENVTITYGDPVPEYTAVFAAEDFAYDENENTAGIDNENTVAVGDVMPTFTCGYKQGDNAGTYTIVPSGLTSRNYNFVYVNGTLTVEVKEITVTLSDGSSTYLATDMPKRDLYTQASPSELYTGGSGGSNTEDTEDEVYTFTVYQYNAETGEYSEFKGDDFTAYDTNAGTYFFILEQTNDNYSITVVSEGKHLISIPEGEKPAGMHTIAPKKLNVTIEKDDREFTFDGLPHAVRAKIDANQGVSDEYMISYYEGKLENGSDYKRTNVAPTEAGTYTVTFESENPNYSSASVTDSFTISPRTVSIVWRNDDLPATNYWYNNQTQDIAAGYYAWEGGEVSDTWVPLKIEITSYSAYEGSDFGAPVGNVSVFKDAGQYTFAVSFAEDTYNYELPDDVTETFTILRAKIDVIIKDQSSEYGDEIVDLANKVVGEIYDDEGDVFTLTTDATSYSPVSSYQIWGGIVTGTDGARGQNYIVTFHRNEQSSQSPTAVYEIKARELLVSATYQVPDEDANTVVYGDEIDNERFKLSYKRAGGMGGLPFVKEGDEAAISKPSDLSRLFSYDYRGGLNGTPAGNYVSVTILTDGLKLANYNFTFEEDSVTIAVAQREISINKNFKAELPNVYLGENLRDDVVLTTDYIEGAIGGEVIGEHFSFELTYYTTEDGSETISGDIVNAGTYYITITLTGGDSYTLTDPGYIEWKVDKALLTIRLDGDTSTQDVIDNVVVRYGDNLPDSELREYLVIGGLVGADTGNNYIETVRRSITFSHDYAVPEDLMDIPSVGSKYDVVLQMKELLNYSFVNAEEAPHGVIEVAKRVASGFTTNAYPETGGVVYGMYEGDDFVLPEDFWKIVGVEASIDTLGDDTVEFLYYYYGSSYNYQEESGVGWHHTVDEQFTEHPDLAGTYKVRVTLVSDSYIFYDRNAEGGVSEYIDIDYRILKQRVQTPAFAGEDIDEDGNALATGKAYTASVEFNANVIQVVANSWEATNGGQIISTSMQGDSIFTMTASAAGSYSVMLELKDSFNYVWEGDTDGEENTSVWTISWRIVTYSGVNIEITGITIGGETIDLIQKGTEGNETLWFNAENWVYNSIRFAAEDINVKVTFKGGDGQYDGSIEYRFERYVSGNWENSATFLGAGTYRVKAIVNDPNYERKESAYVYYTIAKASVALPTVQDGVYAHGATITRELVNYNAEIMEQGNSCEHVSLVYIDGVWSLQASVVSNEHFIWIELTDTDNYRWADESYAGQVGVEVKWKVKRYQVQAPTVNTENISEDGFYYHPEYDGEVKTFPYENSDDSAYYTVSGVTGTNADNYAFTVSLIDTTNYEWAGGDQAPLTYKWKIAQAANSWLDKKYSRAGWTYGGAPTVEKLPSAKFGDLVVTYYNEDDEPVEMFTSGTPAGTYTVVISVKKSANYTSPESITAQFTVAQAPVTVIWDGAEGSVYNGEERDLPTAAYNALLGEGSGIALNVTYSFENGFKDAGSYTFTAAFKADDAISANYEIVSGEQIVCVISAAKVQVEVLAQSAEYTGDKPKVSQEEGIAYNISSGKTYDDFALTFSIPEDARNAGTYAITAACANDNNYSVTFTGSAVFTITPKNIGVSITAGGGTYGNVTQATAKADDDNAEVTLTYAGTPNGGEYTEYGTQVPTQAGSYVVTATVADGNYLVTGNNSAPFVIGKARVTVQPIESKMFTNQPQEADINVSSAVGEPDIYTVVNDAWTDVGSYEVKFTFNEGKDNNFVWFYNDSEVNGTTLVLSFNITILTAARNPVTLSEPNGWTYGNDPETLVTTANFGTPVLVYAAAKDGVYGTDVPLHAGTYWVKAVVLATNNNERSESAAYEFTISALELETPEFADAETVYNGGAQTNAFTGYDRSMMTISSNSGALVTTDGFALRASNVGEYFITFALSYTGGGREGDYIWKDAPEDDSVTITWTIKQAQNGWIGEYTRSGWTYGQAASEENIPDAEFGTVVVEYFTDSALQNEYRGSFGSDTDAGIYYVRVTVEGNSNYTGLTLGGDGTLSFEVEAAQNKWKDGQNAYKRESWTYGDAATAETLPVPQFGRASVAYYTDSAHTKPYTGSFDSRTNAGIYYVVITVDGGKNYSGITLNGQFEVEKRGLDLPSLANTADTAVESGDTLHNEIVGFDSATMNMSELGSGITTINGKLYLAAKDAGVYQITISLADTSNYQWTDGKDGDVTLVWTLRRAELQSWTEESESRYPDVIVSAEGGIHPSYTLAISSIPESMYGEYDLSAYENAEIALGYDIGFTSGGEVVQPDTAITVRLKVTDEIASALGEGYTLLHLHGGEWSEVSYTINNGYAVFTVTEFSDFLFITATPATSLVWLIVVLAVLLAVEIILLVVVIVKRRKGRN